jgi:hypothetical protein
MGHPPASTSLLVSLRKISVGITRAIGPWAMADLILLRKCLTARLPASIVTTGLFAAGVSASGKTKARDQSKPRARSMIDQAALFNFARPASMRAISSAN